MTDFRSPVNIYRGLMRGIAEGKVQVRPQRTIRRNGDILGHIDHWGGSTGETQYRIKRNLPDDLAGETLLHEAIHDQHPGATEEEVEEHAPKAYKQLGPKRRSILNHIAKNGT